MPENINERVFVSTRSYDCQVIIKDKDYTADLDTVRIISSITAPYQSIFISLFIDQNDITLSKLYGQDHIKLTIRLLEQSQDGQSKETIDFDLMYVSSDFSLITQEALSEGKQKDRIPISIVAVPRKSFITATSFVNKIYLNKTSKEIIEDLVSTFTNAKIKYDKNGLNDLVIDQCIVPPTTLIKALEYLDRTFGLFNGPFIHFIDRDNKLHILNMNKKFNEDQTFTVYHLAQNAITDDILKICSDGKNFYTFEPIKSLYAGNTMYALLATSQYFVVKPRDTLSYTVMHNMDSFISKYGVVWKNPKSYVNSAMNNRVKVYTKNTGYDDNESFSIAYLSKIISSMAGLDITLGRNLPILKLMEVGRSVKLIEQHTELIDIAGKFILRSSNLTFVKGGSTGVDWEATASLKLIRTNKTI